MRILQLLCFPLHGSGSGTYVRKLSEVLVKNGHDVAIVCPDSREIEGIQLFEVKLPFMAAFTGHPEHSEAKLYSELSGAQLNDIQAAFQDTIVSAVEEFKPDVVHVHHASNLSWVANYIKAVYQVHFIVTSHNTDIINAILDKRYIPLTQDALNRADIITAVSKNTRERLLKILGKNQLDFVAKTKVVPCGVDTSKFPNKGTTKDADAKYNLGKGKVALYSGKITSIKGVDLFIKAAKYFPEAKFVIMGDGDERKNMEKLAQDKSISNIIFTGYIGSDNRHLIAELYRRANVTVVPSTVSEGIPLTVLEAMSSGSPVVGSDIGGIPTPIKHMKNGILVKPKSVSSLVQGIKLIFENPQLVSKFTTIARSDAVEKYDWKVIAQQMDKYYALCYDRGQKNKSTKKPSFISDQEYTEGKEDAVKYALNKN